jgi:uncharacterized repeat protein (TIGR03803 family)
MKSSLFVSHALSIGAAAVSLAACGGSQPPMNTNVSRLQTQNAGAFHGHATKQGFRVLYSFGLPPDGSVPEAGLIYVDGTFYGTTSEGGEYYTGLGSSDGTVFTITTSGKESVIYSFRGGSDGAFPTAPLLNENGTLYGTTESGGSSGDGTVYSVTATGTEKVLHSFSGADGATPEAGLIDVNGVLYGTTYSGGSNTCKNYDGCGTVFRITKDGTEKVLHSFGAKKDGAFPVAALIDINGTLYGTTSRGGEYDKQKVPYEGGVVFRITTGGTEKVLHNFGNRSDGAAPEAGL